jgi:hypothetical protein
MVPKKYFEQNHIFPGHHIQVPRDERPMRNNANMAQHNMAQLSNGWTWNHTMGESYDDANNVIGPGNSGYGSMVPKTYFE